MCSKSSKIPGLEVQPPSKLTKTRSRFLKENNTAVQHVSTEQSAAKRTRYTNATGPSKGSCTKGSKELKHHTETDCLPRALSNETINIPKGKLNATIKQVHKSSDNPSLLNRSHFIRTISNEEAQSHVAVPSQRCLSKPKIKNNLVHAISNEALRDASQNFLHHKTNAVHNSTETLNLLKRPHFTRVESTEESHILTAPNGHSTKLTTVATGTFNCNASSNVDHMPPYVNEVSTKIPPQTSCGVVPHHTHANVNNRMDEESHPVTLLACSPKYEVSPKPPSSVTDNAKFFDQFFGKDILPTSSVTSYSPLPSQLLSSRSLSNAQDSYISVEQQSKTNHPLVCSKNPIQSLLTAVTNVNYNSHFPGEIPLAKNLDNIDITLPLRACTVVQQISTDNQRPNLLSLNSSCCTDQEQLSTIDILSKKWRTDQATLISGEIENSDVVSFNHIGHKVVLSGEKIGVLKYFGGVEFVSGNWCGIELDEPDGLNDGSVKGKRYFTCKSGHGILAPQSKVQVYRPIKSKNQYCDILPLLGETPPSVILGTKNSMSRESSENFQPDTTATPSTMANSNQIWEPNVGSPKAAQQINISKQNSFELDESLGILTPDQLPDQLVSLSTSVDSFLMNQTFPESLPPLLKDTLETDVLCESDGSEDLLSRAVLSKSDPKNADVSDRTLSPEDLPMDPPGQSLAPLGGEDVKEVRSPGPSSRSHPPSNSIITSITSIGSLDTDGYQGDGELSRPASRNNCTSPTGLLPHKVCALKMKTSTQDPMTDSDFFTESDADDLAGPGKGGDRHAQVIDGTLYNNANTGGSINQQHQRCPSFTASINEEMESSGVYSDLERKPEENHIGTGNEEKAVNIVFSPDISTNTDSTKSEPSQVKDATGFTTGTPNRPDESLDPIGNEITIVEHEAECMEVVIEIEHKDFEGSPSVISNASSQGLNDIKPSKKGVELKKYKMPKRNVVSKIKAMIEASPTNRGGNASTEEENLETTGRGTPVKAARKGRWDAVMSKIAQGQADEKMKPPRLKEVKSKVFASLTENQTSSVASTKRKLPGQSPTTKKESQTPLKTKSRRARTRASSSSSLPPGPQAQPDGGVGNSPNSSQRSSLSDLAATPTTKTLRSSKKVLAPPRSTSPSPASDLSAHSGQTRHQTPQHVPARVSVEMKTPPARKPTSRRSEKHKILRDHNRLAACLPPKQQPAVEPPPVPQVPTAAANAELRHSAKCVQTLAVMVQYLVHEVDAFSAPHLKERLVQMTASWRAAAHEREELLAGNTRLQGELRDADDAFQRQLEGLRHHHQDEFNQVNERYEDKLAEQAAAHAEQIATAAESHHATCEQLRAEHELVLNTNREILHEEHEEEMKLLKAEYDERLAHLQSKYESLESDNTKVKNQYCTMLESMKLDKDSRLQATAEECRRLQEDVHSLKAVLHIRQDELQDMRVKNALLEQIKEHYQAEVNRNSALQLRIEDLEAQLELKGEEERRLSMANHRLSESFQHESFNAKRLSQHNEELKWKLKTQSEIYNQLVPGDKSIDRSIKSLLSHNSELPPDYDPNKKNEKGLCFSDGESPQHKMSYLQRSDSIAWTYDMMDTGKKIIRSGGTVRRIKSFHDTNSTGFQDFVGSPRHVKSVAGGENRRSAIETENFFADWPKATSTPMHEKINPNLNPDSPDVNNDSIKIDQTEQLISLEDMADDKVGCSNLQLPTTSQSTSVPKESAGEAMISEETSEEEDSSEQHSTDEESSSEVMLS